MARVLGLEALRMADTDVLPYDYVAYAREITSYIETAKRKASDDEAGWPRFRARAELADERFASAAQRMRSTAV